MKPIWPFCYARPCTIHGRKRCAVRFWSWTARRLWTKRQPAWRNCKLTPEEEIRMHILLKGIADDPNALEMQKFIQHGSVTTYEHCMRVTRIAFWLNIHLRANADEASLVKGAFLHDFYLYDWHSCRNITHWPGFKHPRIARYNAETVFALSDKEKDIIQSHMWPLTPTDIPHSREAALVCMADKMSSGYETVLERKAQRKEKQAR